MFQPVKSPVSAPGLIKTLVDAFAPPHRRMNPASKATPTSWLTLKGVDCPPDCTDDQDGPRFLFKVFIVITVYFIGFCWLLGNL